MLLHLMGVIKQLSLHCTCVNKLILKWRIAVDARSRPRLACKWDYVHNEMMRGGYNDDLMCLRMII